MSAPLTADTITDAQIRELRRMTVNDTEVSSSATDAACNLCAIALDDGKFPFRTIRDARAACAELLNARKGRSSAVAFKYACSTCGHTQATNGESFFVSRCFALLRAQGVVAIESSADPEARTASDGRRVFRGHVGCVYQGTNGRYVGRTNPSTLRLLPDGRCFSNRASGKIVRGEQGRAYAGSELVAFGAEPLNDGEDPTTWLVRWRDALTRAQRHHGNHRYLWVLDDRRRRELTPLGPERAYPKIGWS